MGKTKRAIERKETAYERKMAYMKRSKGLLKKAYEISVLCDAPAALILYSPSGALKHFSSHKQPLKMLQDYVQYVATMAETQARPVISQDTINKINIVAGQVNVADQQGLEAAPSEDQVNEEIEEQRQKFILLQEEEKHAKQQLIPDVRTFNSIEDFEDRRRFLEEALQKIEQKEKQWRSMFDIIASLDMSAPNVQEPLLASAPAQQDPHREPTANGLFSSECEMETETETEMEMPVQPPASYSLHLCQELDDFIHSD